MGSGISRWRMHRQRVFENLKMHRANWIWCEAPLPSARGDSCDVAGMWNEHSPLVYIYIQYIEKSSYRKQEKHILLNFSGWTCTRALKQKKKDRNQCELQLLIVFLFGRFLDGMLLLLLCTLVLLLYRCLHVIGAGSWIRQTIRNRWRFCTLDIRPPFFYLDSWRQWGTKTEWLKVCGIGGISSWTQHPLHSAIN